jgi:hypothetical protein
VLLTQINITGDQAFDVTSMIHDVVQNVLVATVSIISTVLTTLASASPTPASTPVPTITLSPVLVPAPPAIVPQVDVTYHVPAADAMGPFYWVTCGCHIGIFSTWSVIRIISDSWWLIRDSPTGNRPPPM